MAERGYEAATTAAIVDAASVPISSIYHYFKSKDGILLAVMERGAERFFDAIELPTTLTGPREQQLRVGGAAVAAALQQHPSFLRLLLTLSMRPPSDRPRETREVLQHVRARALERLRIYLAQVFGLDPAQDASQTLARVALAMIDGAFVASQADEQDALGDILDQLAPALISVHRSLTR